MNFIKAEINNVTRPISSQFDDCAIVEIRLLSDVIVLSNSTMVLDHFD